MNILYRPATTDDSLFIASMIDIASDGIATLEWQEECDEQAGQTALDVGSEWYARDEGDYSYRNCLIAETGRPIGMILSFPITKENFSEDGKPPPYEANDIYAPYKYLEALNSWYICGVAVLSEFRKQGIGEQLITLSIEEGKRQGFSNVSLIAVYDKKGLISYYESLGFKVTRKAPIVEHPGIRVKGEVVLMETFPQDIDSRD
ncbi:MAG: GNAT family N-acetyltransferase [Candidatus Thiodiazotropha sp. (ex Semelilucina semeliformis)]|nr:GNAT family N-acetyltransferase [Candidatus Thiodiazotropha sp. (ex Semelilucina semeliformis)]